MKLHDYQEDAVAHLQKNPRSAIFLAMGLGKTAVVLSALGPEHFPALVLAPKRVAEHVWPAEKELWRPDLSLVLAAGRPAERKAALDSDHDVTVLGRDNIADVRPGRFKTIVFDELSGYKGRGVRWRHARKLSKESTYVWGLTGTPVPNGLLDLWAQIYLLDFGERLGRGITHYRNRFFVPAGQLPNGVITSWELRDGAEAKIHELISDLCISIGAEGRTRLPDVTYNTVRVPLPTKAGKHYKDLHDDLVTTVEEDLGTDVSFTAPNAAVLTNRLSQITAGFLYPDAAETDGMTARMHTAKLDALREVEEGTGSPLLVFYRFREELAMLREAFPHARQVDDTGAIDAWNAGRVPMLLAHPASAGHGLNLQHGGHTIVWTSGTWSSEEWEQGNGRLIRQGQDNPVVVHSLVCPGTVDEAQVARVRDKISVQQALLDYLEL